MKNVFIAVILNDEIIQKFVVTKGWPPGHLILAAASLFSLKERLRMDKTYQEIEEILEKYVRPQLREHGGNVELANIKDKIAYVKLTGHCSGCPAAKYTLESQVKEQVVEHTELVNDVKLQEEVSQELYDFAKAILRKEKP